MKRKQLLTAIGVLFILFTTPATAVGAYGNVSDSVKVVKGQVSDYYIAVNHQFIKKGKVVDSHGNPLEGATVMIYQSPMHCNTDARGEWSMKLTKGDTHLYVYYPGKGFKHQMADPTDGKEVIVVMDATRPDVAERQPAVATPWFDPAADNPKTFCNPMNISYNFEPFNNNVKNGGCFRSSADPMLVNHKGEYYLFSTNQGGYHVSKDLSKWNFVWSSIQRKPTDDDQCAPAALSVGDTLFYTGSTYEGLPVWYTTDPKSGLYKRYIEKITLPTWDPYIFRDDDGRQYIYYGSSNEYALKGVEVDTRDFFPISKINDIMMLHPDEHGWERFGMNNDDEVTLPPFTEGAAMTRHGGKYYFQYGAPGTEFKTYADGVYVGDSPLGPFKYQKHNPMCYKPGGYVQGAGHGGTFADNNGNYWHVATCMLSLKYKFERRIGIYPVAFDADGVMYSSTAFGDYPTMSAASNIADPEKRFAGWMLLSYGKDVKVSSADSICEAKNVVDESLRTYWAAQTGGPGEWLEIDLGGMKTVNAIQINYYDHKAIQTMRAADLYHQYRIYASDNGRDWTLVVDKSDNGCDVPHDYIELRKPLSARYLRYEHLHTASGNLAMSAFRVFGLDRSMGSPKTVLKFKVARNRKDPRNAMITWQPVDNAYAYNIRYGTEEGKMYNAITVVGENSYDFRGMDRQQDYWFTIEALSEGGVSERPKAVKAKR